MNLKAQGLPINTLIIAILALAVLIILAFVLTKSSSSFTTSTISCDSKKGNCVPENECKYEKTNFNCPKKEEVCCINPLSF